MAAKNSTILEKVWLAGTNDYQQRVPNPTQSRISATMRQLFSPMNGDLYNQFMAGFINLIGQQKVHDQAWSNPLAVFKGASLMYGSTIQESAVKWIRAHSYDDAAEDLLKLERPEAEVWYHSMNRQDKYPISVVRPELMQAFRDEYGLNRLINAVMQTPINSANYDEYCIEMNLLAEYDQRWGFFRHNLSAFPTDEETGKELLTALRTYAELLKFPSTLYNAADVSVPTFANPSELVLIISAAASASIDVNTLAGIFNLDKADIPYRKVVVPEIPIDNAVAVLTTDAFFVVHDIVNQTEAFNDPNTLATKYIYHIWQVVSASPFVPAILFTTETGTEIPTVTETVTGLTLSASADTIERGGIVQLNPTLTGSLAPSTYANIEVAPDSATYEVTISHTEGSGDNAVTTPVATNTRTYVDRLGRLHLQSKGVASGDTVIVNGTATYINPSGTTNTYTAQLTLTVA